MINIEEYLKESKPDISDSTVSAYTLNLHKLHDRLHGTREFDNIEWPAAWPHTAADLTPEDAGWVDARAPSGTRRRRDLSFPSEPRDDDAPRARRPTPLRRPHLEKR